MPKQGGSSQPGSLPAIGSIATVKVGSSTMARAGETRGIHSRGQNCLFVFPLNHAPPPLPLARPRERSLSLSSGTFPRSSSFFPPHARGISTRERASYHGLFLTFANPRSTRPTQTPRPNKPNKPKNQKKKQVCVPGPGIANNKTPPAGKALVRYLGYDDPYHYVGCFAASQLRVVMDAKGMRGVEDKGRMDDEARHRAFREAYAMLATTSILARGTSSQSRVDDNTTLRKGGLPAAARRRRRAVRDAIVYTEEIRPGDEPTTDRRP